MPENKRKVFDGSKVVSYGEFMSPLIAVAMKLVKYVGRVPDRIPFSKIMPAKGHSDSLTPQDMLKYHVPNTDHCSFQYKMYADSPKNNKLNTEVILSALLSAAFYYGLVQGEAVQIEKQKEQNRYRDLPDVHFVPTYQVLHECNAKNRAAVEARGVYFQASNVESIAAWNLSRTVDPQMPLTAGFVRHEQLDCLYKVSWENTPEQSEQIRANLDEFFRQNGPI